MQQDDAAAGYDRYQSWKDWRPEAFARLDAHDRAYFDAEFRQCGVEALSDAAVLEIGFGNGALAAWFEDRGARYTGTEQIPELIAAARDRGFDVRDGSESLDAYLEPDSLDVVVAFDVFEHITVPDLRDFLAELRRMLKPGGLVVARVPSGDSPFSRSMQHGDLTHVTTLGASAVEQLAGQVGFEVHQVREPAYPVRGLGLSSFLRRLAVTLVRRLVHPIVTHALMGGGRPVLTPGLVFVLRRPASAPTKAAGD